MAEEYDPTDESDDAPEAQATPEVVSPPETNAQLAKAEKRARRAERKLAFYEQIQPKYPNVTWEDLEDIPIAKWEKIAPRFGGTSSAKAEEPSADEQTLARAQRLSGTSVAPPIEQETASDWQKKYESGQIDRTEYLDGLRNGRVKFARPV